MRVRRRRRRLARDAAARRFDIAIEEDLIEELARIFGFDAIAEARRHRAPEGARRSPKQAPVEAQALEILATRGYQEAITYASSIRRCRTSCSRAS